MPNYKRFIIPGGCFFFTVCLADRQATILVDHVEELKAAWRWTRKHKPFASPAWVILPDHMHCIWKLPPDDSDYASRWNLLKGHFTRALVAKGHTQQGNRARERAIWQRRYWEHAIRDDRDFENHMWYIRKNPVKHGLVRNPEDWVHSSFARLDASEDGAP